MFFLVYFRQIDMEMTKKSASSGKAGTGAPVAEDVYKRQVLEGFRVKLAIFHKIKRRFLVTFSNCSPKKNRT